MLCACNYYNVKLHGRSSIVAKCMYTCGIYHSTRLAPKCCAFHLVLFPHHHLLFLVVFIVLVITYDNVHNDTAHSDYYMGEQDIESVDFSSESTT